MERIKDYLLLEEEFVQNQERLKPREEKNQVYCLLTSFLCFCVDDCGVGGTKSCRRFTWNTHDDWYFGGNY